MMTKAKKRLRLLLIALFFATPFFWGCSSSSSSSSQPEESAPEIFLTEQVRAGNACPAGGLKVVSGRDIDGDGRLRGSEIESSRLDCDAYAETDVINTAAGSLYGLQTEDKQFYFGIPFAKPPVGDLRWKAPQDMDAWTGSLEATKRKDVCFQGEMKETWHATGNFIGSEDCLYLDVYRPNTNETNLPVYVFLHGGANRFGGAASYDGSYLADDQNIIVVIPQYRLGPLGWLTHPSLRAKNPVDEQSASGNFGLLDNIKALEWVRENIAAFGGDPESVTMGGQSAGASNVAKMLISPLTEGMFQGAVIQSLGGDIITPEAGDFLVDAMLDALGYDPADSGIVTFLRQKSPAELIAAHSAGYAGFADGEVLPGGYVESIYSGNYHNVPIMLGSTEYEWKNFMPLYAPVYGQPLWGNVYDLFDSDFDKDKNWRFDEIFPTQMDISLYESIGKYRSLGWKSKSVDELAKLLTNRDTDVFAYQFKWGGPDSASIEFAHVFGAAHSMDIPFFFGYDKDLFDYALTQANQPGFEGLQDVMMEYLGNFIRQGDPDFAAGVSWERWSNDPSGDSPRCMVLDADRNSARIQMDTKEVMPVDLPAMVKSDMQGWPEPLIDLIMSQVVAYPPEYYLNDENHELLFSNLAFDPLPKARALSGVHAQAGYRIELPDDWEAGDDLVMYAHGFRGDTPELSVTNPGRIREYLIGSGFAWAASSYTANGYNILSGVESTRDLLDYFKDEFGEPGRVYIVGHSMGGHIAARTITDSAYANDYDGALPMCGVVGGGSELFSYFLDWGLLANYYADLNYSVPFSENQNETFLNTAFGENRDGSGIFGYLPPPGYFGLAGADAILTPAGEALKTATMYRSGGKRPLYDNAFSRWATFAIMGQSPVWLHDPTGGTGTNIVGNASTVFHLDDNYASQSDAEKALNDEIRRVNDPVYDFDDLMYPVSGNITIPVLTLHTLGDLFVPFSMPQIWAERIEAAGNQDLFKARAIRSGGHCTFTLAEEMKAFIDLVAWVENGSVPAGDDILDPYLIAADDFGCEFTTAVVTAYGDDPERVRDDPAFATICNP